MPLEIVFRNEQFTEEITVDGVTVGLTLRRPTLEELRELDLKYLASEKPDYLGYGIAKAELAIVGWDARIQHGGMPLPYSRDLVKHLPDELRAAALARLGGVAPFPRDSRQTSPPSSGKPNGEPQTPA